MQLNIKGTSIHETFKFSQELGCAIGMVRGLENQDTAFSLKKERRGQHNSK